MFQAVDWDLAGKIQPIVTENNESENVQKSAK